MNIKNSFSTINRLPPETLALVAGFLKPGHQLLDATAVCQHWREVLLSSPRLWGRIRYSKPSPFEAYLERSKSAPLKVQLSLHNPQMYSHFYDLLVPHTSRLASLAIRMKDPQDFHQIMHQLQNPIPTLRKFSILTPFGPSTLELPSNICKDYLPHVKKLRLDGMSSFQSPHGFPHVTEFKWVVDSDSSIQVAGLLSTMEQLPALERIDIVFRASNRYITTDPAPRMVTLPHVRWISLRCFTKGIPNILEYLKLPNLTSLFFDAAAESPWPFPTLPVTSFDEHLPNFAELPEMEVYMSRQHDRVFLRSPSQALLEYHTNLQSRPYRRDRNLWGSLPLHSVRRLTVTAADQTMGVEDSWLANLLRDLGSLEHLELEGYCGYILRYLRRKVMRKTHLSPIKSLTVRSGAYEIHQATKLKDVADSLNWELAVACINDPKISDYHYWAADGSSEEWDWSDEDDDF